MRTRVVTLLVGLCGALACSSGGDHAAKAPLRSDCKKNSDCESGLCVPDLPSSVGSISYCTLSCKTDADCSGKLPLCADAANGTRICAPSCDDKGHLGFACVDGRPRACLPDDLLCDECGCPDTLRCDPSAGCVAKSAVGGPCREDDECKTGNCSQFAGVCRVPVGAACSTENCDICHASVTSYQYCGRECEGDYQCNGGWCLVRGTGPGLCYPRCSDARDASCPGLCDTISDSSSYYCECGCPSTEAPHPLGAKCHDDAQCQSGSCYARLQCGDPGDCTGYGTCSMPCATDADCGGALLCINVPCVDDTACGPQCLRACDVDCSYQVVGDMLVDFCRDLPETVTGAMVSVCDVKLPAGQPCKKSGECQSGSCLQGSCAALGDPQLAENGSSCTVGADCKSANCVAGRCRGSALLGDGCASGYDCSVGMCCATGAHAGTCANTCN